MGFYNWAVSDNKIFGDDNFASIYSIDSQQLVNGIPVERFLACISADDLPRIAFAVHRAIVTGQPYNETYDVITPSGSKRKVVAYGRCLQNEKGIPSFFSGTAMALDSDTLAIGTDPLEAHCRAAIGLAKQRHKALTVRHLEAAVFSLGTLAGSPQKDASAGDSTVTNSFG